MNDHLTDALNDPAGQLTEALLKSLAKSEKKLSQAAQDRLDQLIETPGEFGRLARVRLAVSAAFLYEHVPDWTEKKIAPLFEWSSPDAVAMWNARKYANHIGSPKLFGLLKSSFLELFNRKDMPRDDLRTYAQWLTTIMIANQFGKVDYPITATEARSALRHAGPNILSSVGHRLATEMKGAPPEEKISRWREVVKPVLEGIWPIDVELQSSSSTFKLVQILLATGEAFPEAAEVIIPLIQPDRQDHNTTVFSISEAGDEMFSLAPAKMLDLLAAVAGDSSKGNVYSLWPALNKISKADPKLATCRRFLKLGTQAIN